VLGAAVGLACPAPVHAAAAPAPGGCLEPATTVVRDQTWAQERLAPEHVWDLTRGGGKTVAVIGSGVDARVPQLRGGVLPGIGLGGPADRDCRGDGTFAAGLIAARPVDAVAFTGVAPTARVLPVRLPDTGDRLAALGTAIRQAVDGGAAVICVAVDPFDASARLREAVAYAAARDVLIVAGAPERTGDAPRPDEEVLRGVLTVAPVDSAGKLVGQPRSGTVDLVAPGGDVTSLGPGGPGHLSRSGAVAAAPYVAGTAVLVRAYHPTLTAEQVARRLERTAERPGTDVPNPRLGWGMVDPYTAVTMVLPDEGQGDQAATAVPAPVAPARVGPRDRGAERAALLVLAVAALLSVLVTVATTAVRRGRARGWRAAAR
jgi:subtilisin family serine protease